MVEWLLQSRGKGKNNACRCWRRWPWMKWTHLRPMTRSRCQIQPCQTLGFSTALQSKFRYAGACGASMLVHVLLTTWGGGLTVLRTRECKESCLTVWHTRCGMMLQHRTMLSFHC